MPRLLVNINDDIADLRRCPKQLRSNVRSAVTENLIDISQHAWNISMNIENAMTVRTEWNIKLRKIDGACSAAQVDIIG